MNRKFKYIVLLCVLVSSVVFAQPKKDSLRIVNIVNFIRQCEPRIDWITEDVLYETVVEQVKIMKKYNLKGTFLLQHDALVDERYQKLLKSLPRDMFEIGGWWEIPQTLVENTGMKWRGRFQWDWHADVGFATGYTPDQRIKLVDTYMADFKKVFGYYPKSIGSWFIDAVTLNYMHDKYDIVASCNCKDQIGTDGYTMWGGYWSQGYYPSMKNAYMPAQNAANQIPVPIFRMLGSDPIHQYDKGLGTGVQKVVSLEPVYKGGGGDAKWCKWYFDAFVDGAAMAYGYTQTGQENSFAWKRMKKGFEIQLPIIRKLLDEGKVTVQTLEESGRWFKKKFKVTPPTSVTVLNDHSEKDQKTVWFNSRYYRANLLWDKGTMRFRDIHLFDEKVESDYLKKQGKTSQCNYYALPVVDGFRWSSKDKVAGLRFKTSDGLEIKGGAPVVDDSVKGELLVSWYTESRKGKIVMKFTEKTLGIVAAGELLGKWHLELTHDDKADLPFKKVIRNILSLNFKQHGYFISAINGKIYSGDNFVITPVKDMIVLDMSLR